jgi:hypothetical protein
LRHATRVVPTLHRAAQHLEPLEGRRLLSIAPPDVDSHDACGDHAALDAAFARNGADHGPEWYTPVASNGLEANPIFTTNAAGLPLLTSRADGVGTKLFLDFDGNGANLPFDRDGNGATFNADEQKQIYETWRDIVSYFSPFNVNVTTVQPPTGGSNPLFAWHLTSNSISGGYAYVNSLTNSGPTGFNQGGDAVSRHSGIAHEFGHILGLQHQGEWDKLGVNVTEYTDGWGPRDVPLMGVDFTSNVRGFIYGRPSVSAASLQADMETVANTVRGVSGGDGFRPDDFGATTATAYVIPTSHERVAGILERWSDADLFRVDVATAGRWHFDATPTFESAASPKLELLASDGTTILAARDDADQRNQQNNDVEFTRDMDPGTYYVRVTSSGDYSELGEYELTASPLPDGAWRTTDVNTSILRGGTVSYDAPTATFLQTGAGSGITGTSDQFRFTYQLISGDGSITSRVDALDTVDGTTQAGIAIRASAANNAIMAALVVKPDGSIDFLARTSSGGATTTVATAAADALPRWLRLTRNNSLITAERSTDGTSWTAVGSVTLSSLPTVASVGLATSSRDARWVADATFSNVAVTGATGETTPTYNALPTPTNVIAAPAAGANSSVVLTWTDVAGETNYAIDRSVDGVNWTSLTTSVAANATTYTDANPFGSMRWWYRVSARLSSTNSVPSAAVSAVNKPSAPAIPNSSYAVPAISAAAGSAIYLNWADVQGDQGYRVERSTDGSTFTQIGTTTTNRNAYNDTTAIASTGYVYRITPITTIGDGVAASLTFATGTRWTTSGLAISSRTSSGLSLTWTDFATETGYRIERTTTGVTGWTSIATLAAGVTSWSDSSLSAVSDYYYRLTAVLPVGEIVGTAIAYAATLPSASLPASWANSDVGTVGGQGSAGSTGTNAFKVVGAGTAVGGTSDQFHYLYQTLPGNGSITVRLDSLKSNDIDDNAEAGIMIRESLAANARYAFVNVEPGRNGDTDLEYRSSTGGGVTEVDGPDRRTPGWLRLTRTGTSFLAEASPDNVTWTAIGTAVTISMSTTTPIYIGMAVSAIEPNLMTWANFSSVTTVGTNTAPTVATSASATPNPVTGTTTNLSVLGADDGGETALKYTWSTVNAPTGVPTPTFSVNGTNASKSAIATFGAAGTYLLRVTIADASGLQTTSDVSVIVQQTVSAIVLLPGNVTLDPSQTQLFTPRVTDQFGTLISSLPTITWSSTTGTFAADGTFVAPASAGIGTATATIGAVSGSVQVATRLRASNGAFLDETLPLKVTMNFNANVAASLDAGDFELLDRVSGTTLPTSTYSVSFASGVATMAFNGILPDSRYRLTALAGGITGAGVTLTSNYSVDFAFLQGDANRDGAVNFDDLLILAANYNGAGNRSQGDFSGDGAINFDDLLLLASRYNTSFAPAAASTPPALSLPPKGNDGDAPPVSADVL